MNFLELKENRKFNMQHGSFYHIGRDGKMKGIRLPEICLKNNGNILFTDILTGKQFTYNILDLDTLIKNGSSEFNQFSKEIIEYNKKYVSLNNYQNITDIRIELPSERVFIPSEGFAVTNHFKKYIFPSGFHFSILLKRVTSRDDLSPDEIKKHTEWLEKTKINVAKKSVYEKMHISQIEIAAEKVILGQRLLYKLNNRSLKSFQDSLRAFLKDKYNHYIADYIYNNKDYFTKKFLEIRKEKKNA